MSIRAKKSPHDPGRGDGRATSGSTVSKLVAVTVPIILALQLCDAAKKEPIHHYAIVIDCGSSGTRANFYQWDSNLGFPNYSNLLNNVEAMKDSNKRPLSKKVTPGLSTLTGDKEKTKKYFKDIFDYIDNNFSNKSTDRLRSTAVYILATAGMRLLEEDMQQLIIKQTTEVFQERYKFVKVKTEVISGADEGMFTWLTANSRLSLFTAGEKMSTKGIIEMGGASVQVTYRLTKALKELIRRRLAVTEAATKFLQLIVKPMLSSDTEPYQLVSATFLGLGGNSARQAYLDMLISRRLQKIQKEIGNPFFRNPKMLTSTKKERRALKKMGIIGAEVLRNQQNDTQNRPEGEEIDIETETLMNQQTMIIIDDPCLPINDEYQVVLRSKDMFAVGSPGVRSLGWTVTPEMTDLFAVHMRPKSNYKECLKNMNDLIILMKKERMNCENIQNEACSMALLGTPFIPFDKIGFIGVGDLHWTNKYLDGSDGLYDQYRVQEKAQAICDMTYKEILEKWPEINSEDKVRASTECFKGVWVYVMLTKGFGLGVDNDNFRTMEKIEGYKLEWTLGASLEKSLTTENAIASWPEDPDSFETAPPS